MFLIEHWVVTLLCFLQLPSLFSINIKLSAIFEEKDDSGAALYTINSSSFDHISMQN
jgi:hypothetical protein